MPGLRRRSKKQQTREDKASENAALNFDKPSRPAASLCSSQFAEHVHQRRIPWVGIAHEIDEPGRRSKAPSMPALTVAMCATRPRPSPSNPFHRLHPRLATNVRACSGTEDPRPPARASDEKIRTKAIVEEWRADVSPQHWGDEAFYFQTVSVGYGEELFGPIHVEYAERLPKMSDNRPFLTRNAVLAGC